MSYQYKKISYPSSQLLTKKEIPEWIIWIHDLVQGAGFSYSRIAYRIGVSPSTIQKLATNNKRKPRTHILLALKNLHDKIFQSIYAQPSAIEYWQKTIVLRKKLLDTE